MDRTANDYSALIIESAKEVYDHAAVVFRGKWGQVQIPPLWHLIRIHTVIASISDGFVSAEVSTCQESTGRFESILVQTKYAKSPNQAIIMTTLAIAASENL